MHHEWSEELPAYYSALVRRSAMHFVAKLLGHQLTWAGLPRGERTFFENFTRDKASGASLLAEAVPRVLPLLLGHDPHARAWRKANGVYVWTGDTPPGPTVACVLELLLCMGLDPDGGQEIQWRAAPGGLHHAPHVLPPSGTPETSLLHLLASGGCDPSEWDDVPEPLPPALQARLVQVCARLGACVELQARRGRLRPRPSPLRGCGHARPLCALPVCSLTRFLLCRPDAHAGCVWWRRMPRTGRRPSRGRAGSTARRGRADPPHPASP